MKHHRDAEVELMASTSTPIGQQVAKSHRDEHSVGPRGFAPEAGKRVRISSLSPAIVSIGGLLMGGLLGFAAMSSAAGQPVLAALLLILAAAHLLVAIALKTSVKSVSFDGQCYRITGFLLTEEIAPSDVCLVVKARGVLWNTIRIHFNRPTRFGYDIAFVPAASHMDSANLVASMRSVRNSKHAAQAAHNCAVDGR